MRTRWLAVADGGILVACVVGLFSNRQQLVRRFRLTA